jgi:hypothetical protein
MHCGNSQSTVRCQIFQLNITNVLVAEFRELIRPFIAQIIGLLSHRNQDVCRAGLNALSKLSDYCKISIFLIETSLMCL